MYLSVVAVNRREVMSGDNWCSHCGNRLSAQDIYCGQCGTLRSQTTEHSTTICVHCGYPRDPSQPTCLHCNSQAPTEPASINAKPWPNTPFANVSDRIRFLSRVVKEMISHPSISPSELQQWSEALLDIAITNFPSLTDAGTKKDIIESLGGFMRFIDGDPSQTDYLLKIYGKISLSPVTELQSCLSGVSKSNLFGRLDEKINQALVSSPQSISPVEVEMFGGFAADTLPVVAATDLSTRTEKVIQTMRQLNTVGQSRPEIAQSTIKALEHLLTGNPSINPYLGNPQAFLRRNAVSVLNTAVQTAIVHKIDVSTEELGVLGENLVVVIGNPSLDRNIRIAAARTYIQSVSSIIRLKPERKKEIQRMLAHSFRCRSALLQLNAQPELAGLDSLS